MWIMGSRTYESPTDLLEDIDYTEIIGEDEFNEWLDNKYGTVWVGINCFDASEVLKQCDEDEHYMEYLAFVGDRAADLMDEWLPKLESMLPTEIVELFDMYDVEYVEDKEDA